jgi:hypothetical protein
MLKDSDLKANLNALRRRFIAINFTTPVDKDPINAQFRYLCKLLIPRNASLTFATT